MNTLHAAISDTLDRLGDLDATVWSRAEITLNLQDGYDILCTRTGALFDISVIENVPIAGNWQTELERYYAQQRPGWGLTDEPFHMTGEHERNLGVGGRVGSTYRGPVSITSPTEGRYRTRIAESLDIGLVYQIAGIVTVSPSPIIMPTGSVFSIAAKHTGTSRIWTIAQISDSKSICRIVGASTSSSVTIYNPPGTVAATISDISNTTPSGTWIYITYNGTTVSLYGPDHALIGAFNLSGWSPFADGSKWSASGVAGSSLAPVYIWQNRVLSAGDVALIEAGWPSTSPPIGNFSLSTASMVVPGGTLSDATIDVLRVAYNQRGLVGMNSAQMREFDPQYEQRVGGDPSYFVMDKDGLNYIRFVPPAQGNAVYDTVDGSWGTLTYTDDTSVSVEGSYGILRYRTGCFPSGGPWGTPTRIHPVSLNTTVEITRLGRDLATYHFEIPEAYVKYVIFYAMSRALRRDGPGQDLILAEHYEQRFEQGVYRLDKRVQNMVPERRGVFGAGAIATPFGIGDPQPPPAYGVPR